MKKIIVIAWKDFIITFKDIAALIMMLAAPLLLILGLGAVTGAFSRAGTMGLSEIPVVIVNQDAGRLGDSIVAAFESEQMAELFSTTKSDDEVAARFQLEEDQAAAVIIIPPGFSDGILPDLLTGHTSQIAPVEVYSNPVRPISAGIALSVVTEVVNRIEAGPVGGQVIIAQLVDNGYLLPQDVPEYVPGLVARLQSSVEERETGVVRIDTGSQDEETTEPGYLAYLAPGMAVFFLMYTVTQGGRSILAERDQGTLSRMLVSPTSTSVVLGGKMLAIYITGFIQVSVLILVSAMLFGLRWGDPVGLIALIAAVAAAATGWGILLASFAKTPFQVSSVGSALMLLFGVLGGVFIPIESFSTPVRMLSRITPNAWAMDGFSTLAGDGRLADLATPIGALFAMAAILFVVAVFFSRQRWISGFVK
ncbi:MAG: ABC transporter permease [Anaerolineales bacterium]